MRESCQMPQVSNLAATVKHPSDIAGKIQQMVKSKRLMEPSPSRSGSHFSMMQKPGPDYACAWPRYLVLKRGVSLSDSCGDQVLLFVDGFQCCQELDDVLRIAGIVNRLGITPGFY
jgi:hypothetical protein